MQPPLIYLEPLEQFTQTIENEVPLLQRSHGIIWIGRSIHIRGIILTESLCGLVDTIIHQLGWALALGTRSLFVSKFRYNHLKASLQSIKIAFINSMALIILGCKGIIHPEAITKKNMKLAPDFNLGLCSTFHLKNYWQELEKISRPEEMQNDLRTSGERMQNYLSPQIRQAPFIFKAAGYLSSVLANTFIFAFPSFAYHLTQIPRKIIKLKAIDILDHSISCITTPIFLAINVLLFSNRCLEEYSFQKGSPPIKDLIYTYDIYERGINNTNVVILIASLSYLYVTSKGCSKLN